MFYQYGYKHIIEEPTYPINYDKNKSLIDLVFIFNKEKIISKYLVPNLTETMRSQRINIVCNFEKFKYEKFINRYKITDNTIQKLNEQIAKTDWEAMRDNNSGINEIYRKIISKLQTLIKRNIPTVKVRVSRKYPKNVRKLISKIRKDFRKYRKSCEQKYLESYMNLILKP
jgi:hypothetical protein